ncbi:fatty acid desaturase 4, chloroplastic [Lactuca sativa]|uniref:Lipid desaturase domain-containing protein n=1 Tax=Lactuca sativa TaxID=4236 RepID=A0A9R1XC07_LACSA|nr:fatty acid desaturase 4, chloroplastic [Lactuca sativa]KAJ0207141.1 hypothetical protein LSAT_V11C500230310 [Lactuca sativa]
MSILPQHHHLQHADATTGHHHHHRNRRVYCTATPPNTRPKLQKLVANTTPVITQPKLDVDPSLKSTWLHRAWLATGSTTVVLSLANSIIGSIDSHIWLEPVLSGFAGYLFSDLATGIYHWGIDNYGDASTPLIGAQCDMALGHHKWPWKITKRQVANNLHLLAGGVTFTMLPINLIYHDQPVVMGFLGVASGCVMFSQQFHAWAHGTKSKLPPIVVALQDAGVILSPSHHVGHHTPPYKNYCIVSGVWDRFLDKHRVYEALEMAVFRKFGLRPRSWSEPDDDCMVEAEASPP